MKPPLCRTIDTLGQTEAPAWFPFFLLALVELAVCILLLHAGWGKFGDFQVDFSREVYIPWQLSEGKRLYKDVYFFYGPLSPYVQALFLRVFGPNISVILVSNAVLLTMTAAIVWKIVSTIAGARVAICSVFLFLTTCGLNQIVSNGNYNFLTPYSHALTYGMFLLFGSIMTLGRFARKPTVGGAFFLGLLSGLIFITKPEVFLAQTAALGLGLFLILGGRENKAVRPTKYLGLVIAGAAVAVGLACLALAAAIPFSLVGDALLKPWKMIVDPQFNAMPFYKMVFGSNDIQASLKAVAGSLVENGVVWAFVYSLGILGCRLSSRNPSFGPLFAILAMGLFFVVLFLRRQIEILFLLPRAWPLLLIVALIWLLARHWRVASKVRGSDVLPIALIAAALVLALKIFLNANLLHYGAILLAPAGLLFTIALLRWLPRVGETNPAFRRTAFAGGAAFVFLFALAVALRSIQAFAEKTEVVATSRGAMAWDARGAVVRQALARLEQQAAPGDTLAVLPEGAMINFLTGHANPTPYVNLLLWEYMAGKAHAIMASFRDTPPDWIVLISRDTPEYGVEPLCRGYGEDLCQWISGHYVEEALFGDNPLETGRFGIRLLRREK